MEFDWIRLKKMDASKYGTLSQGRRMTSQSQTSILTSEICEDSRKFSLKIDYFPKPLQRRKYCGLSGGRFALIVAAVLLIILVIILLVVLLVKTHSQQSEKGNTVTPECKGGKLSSYPLILISMDGFRPDYLNRNVTPNLNFLAQHGVRAKFLQPQFPTKTFPNHYSMITGLFPAHHGIVANKFKDDVLNGSFSIGKPDALDPKWWFGEPLWVTAIKQGLVSAAYFWVGSEVPVEGILPNLTYAYNQSHPFKTRIDTVLRWLDLPPQGSKVDPEKDDGKRRPSFITLYFHEPDYTAHRYGPDSVQTTEQIKIVDSMIGRLWEGLTERRIQDKINIILVGDHGMAATSCNRVVFLDKYNVTLDDVETPQGFGGAFVAMDPKPGVSAEDVVSRLKCKNSHMQVFLKEELPKRLHYSNNRRIGKVIAIPEDGWLIGTNSTAGFRYCSGATHGYDNMDPQMRTLFVGHGPSFKKGEIVDHFQNTELYDMMAGLIGVKPAPNDGTPGSLFHLLDPCVNMTIPEPKSDGKLMRTDICRYPTDSEAANRRECKLCVCPWCQLKNKTTAIPRFDKMLDLSDDQESELQKKHLPWGIPQGGAGQEGCLLTQQDFVNGYSTFLHLPLWVAYRLDGEKTNHTAKRRNCFRRDVRLTDAQASHCDDYYRSSFDRGHMAPKGHFDSNDEKDESVINTFLLSNMAPQVHGFNAGIWAFTENMARALSEAFSSIYVISGSIFDENADGLRDDDAKVTRWLKNNSSSVAIPTHFYKIFVRCDVNKKPYYKVPGCEGRLNVLSFVLPHLASRPCSWVQSSSEYLLENVATVRDIELLTGIEFFNELPLAEQARIKTISPVKLWSRYLKRELFSLWQ